MGCVHTQIHSHNKARGHPHVCSHSCLTKFKDRHVEKGCGMNAERKRNVISILGSQQLGTGSKYRKKSLKVTQMLVYLLTLSAKQHKVSLTWLETLFKNCLIQLPGNIIKAPNATLHCALHQPFHHCTNTCALPQTHTPFPH